MKYFLVFLVLCLTGCNAPSQLPFSTQRVIFKAEQQGFKLKRYATQSFLLTTYEKLLESQGNIIHIYIEGDGNSWKTRYKLSDNPTPYQPLALKLAMLDPHQQVIYIARPCQYTPLKEDINCDPKYWSSHRYAPEVIASMSEVLDMIKKHDKHKQFILIGFSGGASIAVLLTAKRQDIVGLITVAGDLNHKDLNKFHRVTPLSGSLNPSEFAHLLKDIPQLHLNGSKDDIVPIWMAQSFAKKVDNPNCVTVHTLKNAHHKGWEENWAQLLKRPLACA